VPTTGIATELFTCNLPFKVPTLHVDALWHRRKHAMSDHLWLRETLMGVSRQVFQAERH